MCIQVNCILEVEATLLSEVNLHMSGICSLLLTWWVLCVVISFCDCVWFIYNCTSVQYLKIIICNVRMEERWKTLCCNLFAAGTAYVSDVMWASYIKIAFLHMPWRHVHVSESRIWMLQAVLLPPPRLAYWLQRPSVHKQDCYHLLIMS